MNTDKTIKQETNQKDLADELSIATDAGNRQDIRNPFIW